jgi:hypothetical protein
MTKLRKETSQVPPNAKIEIGIRDESGNVTPLIRMAAIGEVDVRDGATTYSKNTEYWRKVGDLTEVNLNQITYLGQSLFDVNNPSLNDFLGGTEDFTCSRINANWTSAARHVESTRASSLYSMINPDDSNTRMGLTIETDGNNALRAVTFFRHGTAAPEFAWKENVGFNVGGGRIQLITLSDPEPLRTVNTEIMGSIPPGHGWYHTVMA